MKMEQGILTILMEEQVQQWVLLHKGTVITIILVMVSVMRLTMFQNVTMMKVGVLFDEIL